MTLVIKNHSYTNTHTGDHKVMLHFVINQVQIARLILSSKF